VTSTTRDDEAQGDQAAWGWATPAWAWPAYLCAVALLVYAVEKGWYAAHGRIGIPGGPHVPDSAYQELHHIGLRQWTLAGLGLAGALLALATVTPLGRHLPRLLMLILLWGALLPMVAGLPYLVADVLARDTSTLGTATGLARPVLQLAVWSAMAWSYQRRSRVLKRRRSG
jgi:hypothetical protein